MTTQVIELRDARSGKPTGTIPLSVLDSLSVVIPENGAAYWFSAELVEAIRKHPDWKPARDPAGAGAAEGHDHE